MTGLVQVVINLADLKTLILLSQVKTTQSSGGLCDQVKFGFLLFGCVIVIFITSIF